MKFKDLRKAWRMVRIAKDDGYDGNFVVLRETMMEDMQLVYGRVLAENVRYQEIIDALLAGKSICDYCEDQKECKNHDRWLEGRCDDFLIRFADDTEAAEAFTKLYQESFERSHDDE